MAIAQSVRLPLSLSDHALSVIRVDPTLQDPPAAKCPHGARPSIAPAWDPIDAGKISWISGFLLNP